MLTAKDLTLCHGPRTAVRGVSLSVHAGELLAIVGPNGSGKSTILRGLARLHRPRSGSVSLEGRDIRAFGSRELARRVALLPQVPEGGLDLSVRELVWRGRYPHQGLLLRSRPADFEAVAWAIHACDLESVIERPLAELSGGERQRAWLALTLAQRPRVLLLDEPTSFLDFEHQLEVMEIVDRLKRDGIAVAAVLHDLALAARYADRIAAIREGALVACGPPDEVLTEAALEQVFGVRMALLRDPASGAPLPVPIARAGTR